MMKVIHKKDVVIICKINVKPVDKFSDGSIVLIIGWKLEKIIFGMQIKRYPLQKTLSNLIRKRNSISTQCLLGNINRWYKSC